MGKKWIAPLLIGVTFLLTSCGFGSLSAEEAGNLFVERLAYQENKEKFEENFQDGAKLGVELDEVSSTFEEDFADGLAAMGAEVSDEEAKQLTEELVNQVKDKATYQFVKVEEEKNTAIITFYITGLDLVSAMKEMTRELVKEVLANPEIAQDDNKVLEATLSILNQRIKSIKIQPDPTEINIELKKEKGKWSVPKGKEDEISNLFYAFISGAEDLDTLNEQLSEAMDEVARELVEN